MQPQLKTHRSRRVSTPIELDLFLFMFAKRHTRSLLPQERRHVNELIEALVEFLEDRGVTRAARHPRGDVTSRTELFDWLDAFETSEMVERFGGRREAMRTADTALRALTRALRRAL